MNVLIITGGNTSEREISLISANEVKKALLSLGFLAELFDLKKGFKELKKQTRKFKLLFPVLHGKDGEDGSLYQFLHTLNKPFVGSDCLGSKLAFDKLWLKKWCKKNDVPTAKWQVIKSLQDIKNFGFPCVLKASEGGSSKEISLIKTSRDLKNPQVYKILGLNGGLFVEEMVLGREITVGVLFNKFLPVIEIIPLNGGWFDYQNKYSGKSQEIIGAPSIDDKTKLKAQQIALKIHQELKLGPYSRTDFIVQNNQPALLETNSPCGVGFTPQSLFPKAAAATGINFNQLVKKLVEFYLVK